ncbi:MAG: hypothetical protein V4690_00780 [Patescibacteria group bacterium]
MTRYRKFKKRSSYFKKRENEFEIPKWIFYFLTLTILFIVFFSFNFVSNCIIEWPPRWDVRTCWSEQFEPAKTKAIEKSAPFMPQLKVR